MSTAHESRLTISIKLGSISIDLVANTVSFSDGMSRASQIALTSSRNIQRSLSLVSGAATAMAAGVVASLGAVMSKAEDFAFEIQKMAAVTGTSSEMFSRLAYNAKLVGAPVELVSTGLQRLAKTAGEAQSGNKKVIEAYGAVGIKVKDLQGPLKNTGDLFVAVSKGLDKYGESSQKTYLEQTLLARSGAELAPLLKQIATGFDTASQQATLFGVVIGDKTAAQAKALHQSFEELESIALGFSLRLLSGVSPALEDVSSKIINFVTSTNGMRTVDKIAGDVSTAVHGLGSAFEFLTQHSTAVKTTLEGIAGLKLASTFVPLVSGAISAGTGITGIGLAAATMVARVTGISALGKVFVPVIAGAYGTSAALVDLAATEGVAATAGYALDLALAPIEAVLGALAAPALVAAAAIGVTGGALYKFRNATFNVGTETFKLRDSWNAAWLAMKDVPNLVAKEVVEGWEFIKPGVLLDVAIIKAAWTAMLAALGPAFRPLTQMWNALTSAVHVATSAITGAWHSMMTTLQNSSLGVWITHQVAELKAVVSTLATMAGVKAFGYLEEAKHNRETSDKKETVRTSAPPISLARPKLDAPSLPKDTTEKVDELKKKMMELRDAAQSAMKSLRDAGKGIDFERSNEIAKEQKKIIDDLVISLKAKGRVITTAEEQQIKSDIATKINADSQAKFRDEVAKGTEQILAQASAQNILTAAIGQVAAATRKAQVDSEFTTKYAGASPEWMKANQDLIAQQRAARTSELAAGDKGKDTAALDSLKQQVSVQTLLNAAILSGRDAMNQARLEQEQGAIRESYKSRGDTNEAALQAELAANEKLFNLKNSEADLNRAAAMDAARVYNDEIASINAAATAARNAGQAISEMQLKAADKAAWNSYLESIDKTKLAVGDMSDGVGTFFREMGRDTTSAAQQVHDVLGGAFNSLNETLAKLVSGQKASFAEFFRSLSSQIAKMGLENAERGIAKSITDKMGNGDPNHPQKGIGGVLGTLAGVGKGDSPTVAAITKGNNTLADILDALRTGTGGNGMPGLPGMPKGFGSGLPGSDTSTSDGAAASAAGSTIKSGLSSLWSDSGNFGGHLALGGDVTAGMTYDVGEMGRERFTPTQDGKITPNKDLGGNGPQQIHIDARGANDPAQTQAAIHRAMQSYAPAIAQSTLRAVFENKQRSPLSSSH
jgi:hypothetical protein